jgi:DNA-directed RNA polymerase III subunit RPC1
MPAMSSGVEVKSQVVDLVPKRFKELKFGIQSNTDIINQTVVEVSDRMLYDIEKNRKQISNGPIDTKMGISAKGDAVCGTCGESLMQCNGHFGHVRLAPHSN